MNAQIFATPRTHIRLGAFALAFASVACAYSTEDALDPASRGSASTKLEGTSTSLLSTDDVVNAADGLRMSSARRCTPHFRQLVVFGDSLSDAGTYDVGTIAAVGGGKFTTNPGLVWAERVGLVFRAPVTPFRRGFGGVSQVLGGTDFAMGGARVSEQPGINCDPDPVTGACAGALTLPVTRQVEDYLAVNGDRFTADQLVFVLAGANDIFFQLGMFQVRVQAGSPIADAQADALAAIQRAAGDLVAQVQRVVAQGAKYVVVLNVPDITRTPFGDAPSTAPVRPLIGAMVESFNGALAVGLDGTKVLQLDLEGELNRVLDDPAAFGVSDPVVPACDATKIAAITGGLEQTGSSLFCSPQTMVSDDAPLTHLFADGVHPSTLGHRIVARFVLLGLEKRGWL